MTPETLVAAMPGLDLGTARAYLPGMETAMREHGITTAPRCWMWLAQTGHESLSLKYMEEIASGSKYEGRQDLGNTQRGDGVRFKGRGPIQITGRYNYTKAGQALGLDLAGNPGLAGSPAVAFRISAWWWATHGLNEISDRQDVVGASRRINGGTRGLADRQERYARCRALGDAVLPGGGPEEWPEPEDMPELHVDYLGPGHNEDHGDVQVWQAQMSARGWRITVSGIYDTETEGIARLFQREKGLHIDGLVGPDTWRAAWAAPVT